MSQQQKSSYTQIKLYFPSYWKKICFKCYVHAVIFVCPLQSYVPATFFNAIHQVKVITVSVDCCNMYICFPTWWFCCWNKPWQWYYKVNIEPLTSLIWTISIGVSSIGMYKLDWCVTFMYLFYWFDSFCS